MSGLLQLAALAASPRYLVLPGRHGLRRPAVGFHREQIAIAARGMEPEQLVIPGVMINVCE